MPYSHQGHGNQWVCVLHKGMGTRILFSVSGPIKAHKNMWGCGKQTVYVTFSDCDTFSFSSPFPTSLCWHNSLNVQAVSEGAHVVLNNLESFHLSVHHAFYSHTRVLIEVSGEIIDFRAFYFLSSRFSVPYPEQFSQESLPVQ